MTGVERRRLAVSCLEETIAHYIASLLTYTRAITDPFLKRMDADKEQLLDFFEKNAAKERVRPPSHRTALDASSGTCFVTLPLWTTPCLHVISQLECVEPPLAQMSLASV